MSTVATLLSVPGVPELYVVASVDEHSSRYHGLYLKHTISKHSDGFTGEGGPWGLDSPDTDIYIYN